LSSVSTRANTFGDLIRVLSPNLEWRFSIEVVRQFRIRHPRDDPSGCSRRLIGWILDVQVQVLRGERSGWVSADRTNAPVDLADYPDLLSVCACGHAQQPFRVGASEHHVHLAVRIVDDEGILRQHPARAGRGSSDRWREHAHCIPANSDTHIASRTCRYYD